MEWLPRRHFLSGLAVGIAVTPPLCRASDLAWKQLQQEVMNRQEKLRSMIKIAQRKRCCTDYAEVSSQVISMYLKAAQYDRDHMDRVRTVFQQFRHYSKIDPVHTERLPESELEACIDIAEYAMKELKLQLSGTITLTAPPDMSRGSMKLAPKAYELDGRPVYPSSLVWSPQTKMALNCFGRIGGGYLQLSQLDENLKPRESQVRRRLESLRRQNEFNMAPRVFLTGHAPAGWMTKQHPEILYGGRNFTKYDIDSPLIRDWIKTMYREFLPGFGKACGTFPMVHLLANEPHFATAKGGWLSKNGLSDYTMAKFYQWLESNYGTIDSLNAVYGTAHTDWEQVLFHGVPVSHRQIDKKLRGTPVWYDWLRFNMDRVNEWFTYLKDQAQAHDGGRQAPATIKVLGFSLSKSERDGGMDMEYLTDLQDIMGADLRCAPRGAVFFGKHEEGMDPETGWQSYFSYDWSEQSMYLDFSKSICPDKVFYDSEWHGFGAVSWRHFTMSRDYVRSALWFAFSHGMGAINAWLWGRDENGVFSAQADHIGELSTQPIAVEAFSRTLKELNAHAPYLVAALPEKRDFWIYYCEESAIQDPTYTHGFKQVYEALKLLNFSVGFTTPSKIDRLNPEDQTVLVSPTPFIADDSLEKLKTFKGRVVLLGADQSFLKTEQGRPRKEVWKPEAFASLPMSDWSGLVPVLKPVLLPVASRPAVPVEITDLSGAEAYGVSVSHAADPESGNPVLVLNNFSKDSRVVSIGNKINVADLIGHRRESNRIVMAPCAVRLLMCRLNC